MTDPLKRHTGSFFKERVLVNKVIKFIDWIIMIFGGISGVIMIFLMCFTTCDIFARLFNHPILGSTEVTVVGVAALVFLGFGYCALQEGHIRVDIFKGWPWMDRVTNTIAAVALLVMSYHCFVQGNFVRALTTRRSY
jgi:TRAP-type C4-dicarboxylate transport system permease small subunit